MFNLNEGDLKVAKNIWNIVIPLFLAAPVMYFAGIEFPFGFFNVVVAFAIYYALKLCTDQEKALMTPFFLLMVASAAIEAYNQGEAIRYGGEYDEYNVGSHLFFMLFTLASYWGFKSVVPNWARISVLIVGLSQIVATYSSLIADDGLHDIADSAAILMLVFMVGIRSAVVKAANNA